MAFETPTALIQQLLISLRDEAGIPSGDPSPPPLPPIGEAIGSLNSNSSTIRCERCGAGLLRGSESPFCIYCGEMITGGEGVTREISFVSTKACGWLLGSLGLDGSETINLESEPTEPSKTKNPPKKVTVLSDLLDLKLKFKFPSNEEKSAETDTEEEPSPSSYALNLSGVDLDSFFTEKKRETTSASPSIKGNPGMNTQTLIFPQKDTFANWEADFQSNPANPSLTVSGSTRVGSSDREEETEPGSVDEWIDENSKEKPDSTKLESVKFEDESFDDWQDFAGSGPAQVSPAQVSSSDREEKTEPGSLDQWIENSKEKLDSTENERVKCEDESFDDWQDFTVSGSVQDGSSNEEKTEPGSAVLSPVNSKEKSHNTEIMKVKYEDELFNDWKEFTGSGSVQVGSSEREGKTEPEQWPANSIEKSGNMKVVKEICEDESFDSWQDFSGSGPVRVGSSNREEKTEPGLVDQWPPVNNIEKSDSTNIVKVTNEDESFGNWQDFTGSGLAQDGSSEREEKAEPRSLDQLFINSTKESDNMENVNYVDESFDVWQDFTVLGSTQTSLSNKREEKTEISSVDQLFVNSTKESDSTKDVNKEIESYDDWQGFTGSDRTKENFSNEPLPSLEITNQWTMGSFGGVNDSNESDDWRDFARSSQVKTDSLVAKSLETKSMDQWATLTEPKIDNKSLSDDWLDFTGSSQKQKENNNNGLFDDWNDFTSSNQTKSLVKNTESVSAKNDLSDDWLDFTGSTQVKEKFEGNRSTELMSEHNNNNNISIVLSDDWQDVTSSSQAMGNLEFKNTEIPKVSNEDLFDEWQDFAGSGQVTESSLLEKNGNSFLGFPLESKTGDTHNEDFEFGSFVQSDSALDRTSGTHESRTNGVDLLSAPSLPNDKTQISSSNAESSNSNIENLLSQMSDLSFMLKDELSIPK